MTEGQIAVLISVFAVAIAAFTLGWNVYRDLLKPRLKVRLGLYQAVDEKGVRPGPKLILAGTNFGPGEIRLKSIILKPPWALIKKILKRARYGFLFYDYKDPLSSKFPITLEVGDSRNFMLVYNEDCFLKDNHYRAIGITDSFGRMHWAPKKDYRQAKEEFRKQFGGTKPKQAK